VKLRRVKVMDRKLVARASMLFLLVVWLVCTGCVRTVYVHQQYPVIPLPDRPVLVEMPVAEMGKMSGDAQKAVNGNVNALMTYSRQLEVGIKEYNRYAVEENKENE
jgi:hypothetical protein